MLGIIGAMEQEVAAILERISEIKEAEFYGIKYWKGSINGIKSIIGQSGVGKVNAARCTQIMIDKYKPSSIINVGSAGALNPVIEIGDVVISDSCIYHDADITVFGHEKGYITGIGNRFIKADQNLIAQCKEVLKKIDNEKYKLYIGPIATGDQFYNDPEKKAEIFAEFGAYCDDMEAAAIAHVCLLCKTPYVAIRSISDKPASKSQLTFYEYLDLASSRCADFVDSFTKSFISE
ncbi:MAG: 5'-methylthioadenosine/adenosylhomocysteine nucleosidase [Halanaerobiaceae bacterium]